ncbi:MAG: NrfD/PsrC family molybdoenzyme membrane anchor subunit [Coriobacteriia bacterium]
MSEETPAARVIGKPGAPRAASSQGFKTMNVAILVSGAIVLVGLGLWAWQLSNGLYVTNMRNLGSWGLYITNFMFFVGLSAGGLIISSAPRVFGLKGFGGISKIAVWSSICCTVLAMAFVVIDMGKPQRLWELFAHPQLSSPLMWDVIVLAIYLVLSSVYLWATLRFEKGKGTEKSLRTISVFSLVCAVLVHTVTAWIFGLQAGHEFWYTALLGPWFVSSALVSGLALVLLVVMALRKSGYLELQQDGIVKMAKLLGVFLVVDLYFFACDLLTQSFPGGSGADVVSMLVTGPLALFFWTEIIGSIIAAVIVFTPRLRTMPLIATASALAIVGIFAKRVQLLVGGFQLLNLSYVKGGYTSTQLTQAGAALKDVMPALVYFPSPLEFGIVLGVFSLGACMLLLGLRYLPLAPSEKTH